MPNADALPLTDAQFAVVTSTAPRMLVDAGAGSGKTTTVVQQLCYWLGAPVRRPDGTWIRCPDADRLTLDQIAAITYTNEAAADLTRKLRAALQAAGLRELAYDVDSARVGTIHSFCGDLLRDYALRAGRSPRQQVLTDGEASALREEIARRVLHEAIAAQDIDGLPALLAGQSLWQVVRYVATLADNTDRLQLYTEHRGALRPHEAALLTLAERSVTVRRRELAERGQVDFDEMIVATRDLLQQPGVRRAVQREIALLVVDEFQDADPAQRDIALLLGGVLQADPSPTRVVLVGDPKQSIYRFRRADVAMWNDVATRFANPMVGQIYRLVENFRSRPGILAAVDTVIGPLMDAPLSPDGVRQPYEVAYAPLVARAKARDGDLPTDVCVELLAIAADNDGDMVQVETVRDTEAEALVERIQALHADGTSYGDMAILLAGWGALETYMHALEGAGIPCYALRSEGFWETREVLDVLLALRAIRDPQDTVALTGLLRGPMIGVRDETLLALSRAGDSLAKGFWSATMSELPAGASLAIEWRALCDARALLQRFGALRDRIPLATLITRLLEETGFLAMHQLLGTHGAQALGNLRRLVRVAEATPDQSLGAFLQTVQEARARGDRVEQERLYREDADVVTITSVHSAKGLEWDTVFWCDLVRTLRPDNSALLTGRTQLSVKSADEGVEDAEHKALRDALFRETKAEAIRLWYVAMTRAKRRLVLSGVALGKGRSSDYTPGLVIRAAMAPTAIRTAGASTMTASVTAGHPVASETLLTRPPVRVVTPTGRSRLSATQLMAFAHDPAHWWRKYVLGYEGLAPKSAGGARQHGTLVHEILEQCGGDLTDLDEVITGVLSRHGLDSDSDGGSDGDGASMMSALRETLRAMVQTAASHPTWLALSAEPSMRQELSFVRILADGSTVEGAMDLVARTANGVAIVDVKTGALRAPSAETTGSAPGTSARYALQAATYRDAVAAITGAASDAITFTLLSTAGGGGTMTPPIDGGEPSATITALRGWTGADI